MFIKIIPLVIFLFVIADLAVGQQNKKEYALAGLGSANKIVINESSRYHDLLMTFESNKRVYSLTGVKNAEKDSIQFVNVDSVKYNLGKSIEIYGSPIVVNRYHVTEK